MGSIWDADCDNACGNEVNTEFCMNNSILLLYTVKRVKIFLLQTVEAEMKFTTEQRVFIVESFAKEKTYRKCIRKFVVNIQTRQFPQRHVYPNL
jgi:hypothetical protein